MTDLNQECPRLPFTLRRPIVWLIVSWLVLVAIMSIVLFTLPLVFNVRIWGFFKVPIWGYAAIAILVSIPLGIPTAFAGVWFTEHGVTVRSFLTRTYRWTEIDVWTQWGKEWGDGDSIFVRTKSGRVFGFDSLCIYNRERQWIVCKILSTYVGPETKGKRAAIPRLLKLFLRSFVGDDFAT